MENDLIRLTAQQPCREGAPSTVPVRDFNLLLNEHLTLARQHGAVQQRCTNLLAAQRAEIARLHAEVMRLRALVVARDSALAYEREDRAELEASMPGLPKRVALARQVQAMQQRLQALLRERDGPRAVAAVAARTARAPAPLDNLADLEQSLTAADLVICQTGCLSHGEYWRVQDHCKRTGKACVLTAEPDALRIVRIHKKEAAAEADDAPAAVELWVAAHGATP